MAIGAQDLPQYGLCDRSFRHCRTRGGTNEKPVGTTGLPLPHPTKSFSKHFFSVTTVNRISAVPPCRPWNAQEKPGRTVDRRSKPDYFFHFNFCVFQKESYLCTPNLKINFIFQTMARICEITEKAQSEEIKSRTRTIKQKRVSARIFRPKSSLSLKKNKKLSSGFLPKALGTSIKNGVYACIQESKRKRLFNQIRISTRWKEAVAWRMQQPLSL